VHASTRAGRETGQLPDDEALPGTRKPGHEDDAGLRRKRPETPGQRRVVAREIDA